MGIGMGFCNTTFLVAIQANVGFHERGIGTSSQMFMRMIGQSVGAALLMARSSISASTGCCRASAELVNRMLEPATRASLGADTLAKLADAVGLAAHDAFLLAVVLAAVTLTATISLPARLSPIRAAVTRQPAE